MRFPLLRLGRLHFLGGGFLMCLLGATWNGNFELGWYLGAQAMVTSIQLTAQIVNEWADAEVDRKITNRTWFSGGSGVVSGGFVSPETALRVAVTLTVAATAAIAIVGVRNPIAAAIGIGALAYSWAYSAPPFRLVATGWGEAGTAVVIGLAVPIVGRITQVASIPGDLWRLTGALVVSHLGMMLIFELPDYEVDAAGGKRVLAARIGRSATLVVVAMAWVIAALVALTVGDRDMLVPAGLAVAVSGVAIGAAVGGRWPLATAAAVIVPVIWGVGAIVVG